MSSPKTNAHQRSEPRQGAGNAGLDSLNDHTTVAIDKNDDSSMDLPTAYDASIPISLANPELQSALNELQAFLMGETVDQPFIDFKDEMIRQAVAAELVNFASGERDNATESFDVDEASRSMRNRARQLFVDHGYLDDVLKQLSSSAPVQQRAEATRTLGIIRSQRATAPLIAALFDEEAAVREAATKSLAQIGDPSVTIDPNYRVESTEDTQAQVEEIELSAPRPEMYPLTLGDAPRQSTADDIESKGQSIPEQLNPALPPSEHYEQTLEKIAELEKQLFAAVNARNQAEKEVLLRLDQESRFRAEAAARRHEDEEARKRAEEKAARRRYEDERKLATEQLARIRVEEELQEFAANEDRLRLELSSARQVAESLETASSEAEIADQTVKRAEAETARKNQLARYASDVESLRREEESLRVAVEQTSLKRNDVEMARQGIELQTQRLAEETARLGSLQSAYREEYEKVVEAENGIRRDHETLAQRAQELDKLFEVLARRRAELDAMNSRFEGDRAEVEAGLARIADLQEGHRQVRAQRVQLENELRSKTEEEERMLDDLRTQSQEQENRLQLAASQRNDEYAARVKDLDALKRQFDEEASRRADEESLLSQQVEALRNDELEMRNRVEEAEARRNAAEQTNRVLAEQIQRIEADAHARSLEAEGLLTRLERVKREVEMEAQTHAQKVEKIQKEIENLRSLEEEHRGRFEMESRRRAEIEARLQQEKEKLGIAERVRLKTEVLLETLPQAEIKSESDKTESQSPLELQPADRVIPVGATKGVSGKEMSLAAMKEPRDLDRAATLPENVVAGLNSAHPHKRASAVSQLPALHATDRAISFHLIVEYFDDPATEVRNAAARALRDLEPSRPAESFTRALEDATANRERNIGKALASSGIADEAINNLDSENREETYNALCLLFVMAKAGEVQPLVDAIENHQDVEVRRAAIKLLNLSGQSDLADAAAKRRLNLSASAHSNS